MMRFVTRCIALIPASMAALTLFACDEQGTLPAATTSADTSVAGDTSATSGDDVATSATTTAPDTSVAATDTTVDDTSVAATDTTVDDTSVAATDTTVDDATVASDAAGDAGIVLPTEPPPIITTHSTIIGDWTMTPQQEVTKCVVKRLDNATTLWVSQIRTELAKGSHHMIIYKSAETEERATPFDCDPFIETLTGETYPMMITQIRNETLTFPNGVAFKFEPNQMVRLEAHYLNYFPTDITAHGEVHFDGIAAEDVVAEGNMLFYGTPDIDLPKDEVVTTPWYFLDVLPGTKLFAVTGHTHQYGTNVEIAHAASASDPGTPIYPPEDEPFDWEEPPVSRFDPHLGFGGDAGKTGLRYRCTWNNTSGKRIGFGESANSEMCFLWGYYYPSQGYRICISPGSLGGGLFGDQVCCGGVDESPVCDLVRQWAGN